MPTHSAALGLTWQIAALEALYAKHEFIEPQHLFIGLCKLEDITTPKRLLGRLALTETRFGPIQAEVEKLLKLFSHFGLDPVTLRRELRQRKGTADLNMPDDERRTMHRSPESREVFKLAEAMVQQSGASEVNVLHLLAALVSRPRSPVVNWLCAKKIDLDAFREAVLREVSTVASTENEAG